MEKWRGKFAVVTGASAGIGEAIVKDLAKAGINVIGLARRSEKVEEIAEKLSGASGKVYARKCDVADLESVKATFKWIEETFGSVHILVNNAAILSNSTILDAPEETVRSIINTNLIGLVHCTREAIRLIKKSDDYGIIININAVLGHVIPFPLAASMNMYVPTKFAVTALSEVLRQELVIAKNEKIRVSNLSPGAVLTDIIVTGGFADEKNNFFGQMAHLLPENVAETVLFLLEVPVNVNISQLTVKAVGERV